MEQHKDSVFEVLKSTGEKEEISLENELKKIALETTETFMDDVKSEEAAIFVKSKLEAFLEKLNASHQILENKEEKAEETKDIQENNLSKELFIITEGLSDQEFLIQKLPK